MSSKIKLALAGDLDSILGILTEERNENKSPDKIIRILKEQSKVKPRKLWKKRKK